MMAMMMMMIFKWKINIAMTSLTIICLKYLLLQLKGIQMKLEKKSKKKSSVTLKWSKKTIPLIMMMTKKKRMTTISLMRLRSRLPGNHLLKNHHHVPTFTMNLRLVKKLP